MIVTAALRGIAKSHEEYTAWSGGCWLYEAPEYLITTNIDSYSLTIPLSRMEGQATFPTSGLGVEHGKIFD